MTQNNKPKTILYIEDDRGQQKIYKRVFETAGYSILIAEDKTSGFELAQKQNPDIILLDLLLSGGGNTQGGIELLNQLKKDRETQDIPVIVFTNYTGEDMLKKAKDLGAAEVVIKVDVTPHEMIKLLEEKYFKDVSPL